MAEQIFDKITANQANVEELNAGNAVFTGSTRFVQEINGSLAGSRDINTVTAATTIPDSYYIFMSDGSSVKRILFSDLCAAVFAKLSYDEDKTYFTAN